MCIKVNQPIFFSKEAWQCSFNPSSQTNPVLTRRSIGPFQSSLINLVIKINKNRIIDEFHPSGECSLPNPGIFHPRSIGSTIRSITWAEHKGTKQNSQWHHFAAHQVNENNHTITKSCTRRASGAQKKKSPQSQQEKMLIILPEASAWHGGDIQKDDVERKQSKILQNCLDIRQGFFWKIPVGYCKLKSMRDPAGVQTKSAKSL